MNKKLADEFLSRKYLVIRNFLPEAVAKIANRYALMKVETEQYLTDTQVPDTPAFYGDTLMETILEESVPTMEELCGIMLYPTYSYMRVYRQGDELKPHVDRPECEISATVCLGYDASENYNWPIYLADYPDSTNANGSEQVKIEGTAIHLQPGDCMLYRGTEAIHWRTAFEGKTQAQLFLHYVARGGMFKHRKFDGRKMLGQEKLKVEKI